MEVVVVYIFVVSVVGRNIGGWLRVVVELVDQGADGPNTCGPREEHWWSPGRNLVQGETYSTYMGRCPYKC